MKKIILSLGIMTSLSIPAISLIACSESESSDSNKAVIDDLMNQIKELKSNDKTTLFEAQTILINKLKKEVDSLNKEKNVNKELIMNLEEKILQIDKLRSLSIKSKIEPNLDKVTKDGLYLVKGFYGGTIYNVNKQFTKGSEVSEVSRGFERIPMVSGWGRDQSVVQLKKGDSLFMLYNIDDSDGLNSDNFAKSVTFNDTSIAVSKNVEAINKKIGSLSQVSLSGFTTYDINFITQSEYGGYLSGYIGSQNNHSNITWDNAMKEIKALLTESQYKSLQEYYSVASKSFVPFLINPKMFVYQKISNRIIQITYLGSSPITGARFRIWPNGKDDKTKAKTYGTFSISQKDFHSYENSSIKYFFLGRHV